MKQSQWTLAVLVLAAMVFLVTYAMNFLGMGTSTRSLKLPTRQPREVRFFWTEMPIGRHSGIEIEEKSSGYQDFWFVNDNKEPVAIDLDRVNCKCTSVEVFLWPEEEKQRLAVTAVALVGVAAAGLQAPITCAAPLPAATLATFADVEIRKRGEGPHDLMGKTASVRVPPHGMGWVRMRWQNEKIGPQILAASLWMDGKTDGKNVQLFTALRVHEAIRVRPTLPMRVLLDEDLIAGVRRYILCWSSTRPSLRLKVKEGQGRDPDSDPFIVGTPELLSPEETHNLEKQNNDPEKGGGAALEGRVLCAYRIPITVTALSRNKTTPFDVGPFHRRVRVSSPDIDQEPKEVLVTGRVRGVVEIGNDEEGSDINFGPFPKRRGKSDSITLQSDVPGLTLVFDLQRTPKFLSGTLSKPEKIGERRQEWKLKAAVLPEKATGLFPRRGDPLFEDSAIYLKAKIPGKPDRSVRIAVSGTANES